MKICLFILLPVFIFCFALSAKAAEPDDAVQVAQKWITLVDAGKLSESWDGAATLFKTVISKEAWEEGADKARSPFGVAISRSVSSTETATTLPGAPDGEYVIVRFKTRFAGKQEAEELVTLLKETDGGWQVTGYYIR